MNRRAQGVVVMLLGGAVLRASLTDVYLRYVREGLRPFLVGAGLLLVVTGVMTLLHDLRAAPGHPAHDGHDHDGHGPRVGWLLILPVLGLLLVSPPALGSYAVGQSGTAVVTARDSAYPPLPPGDPAPVSVFDYASRALFDKGASIGDRRVRLTGFITPGPDGRPMLARIVLSCCAADGRPVKLGLDGEVPTGLAADTWVEVVGRYTSRTATDPVNHADIPYLRVESTRQVAPPRQQYE